MSQAIMISKEDSKVWEKENYDKILKWTLEYDVRPGFEIITWVLEDKTEVVHQIIMTDDELDRLNRGKQTTS